MSYHLVDKAEVGAGVEKMLPWDQNIPGRRGLHSIAPILVIFLLGMVLDMAPFPL